jgi:hypothetical protein
MVSLFIVIAAIRLAMTNRTRSLVFRTPSCFGRALFGNSSVDPGDSAAAASAAVVIGGISSPAGGRRCARPPIESRTHCPAHAQGRSMGWPHGGDARPAAGKEVMPTRPL